jgi:hypothetical protein
MSRSEQMDAISGMLVAAAAELEAPGLLEECERIVSYMPEDTSGVERAIGIFVLEQVRHRLSLAVAK